jgi:hypothetical protein
VEAGTKGLGPEGWRDRDHVEAIEAVHAGTCFFSLRLAECVGQAMRHHRPISVPFGQYSISSIPP